jgi:hypothetical protein
MYCDGCGAAIAGGQRFCSKCGKTIGAVPAVSRIATHLKTVSILWMVVSVVFCMVPGLFLVLGADFVASLMPLDTPEFIPRLFHGIGVLLIAIAALGIFTGWGLLEGQAWARITAIALAFISLLHIPLGTVLGAYTLWVLLPGQSEAEYRQLSLSGPVR